MAEKITYAEHRRRQREYEREKFMRLSVEERAAAWQQRQTWLWSYFLTLESRWVVSLVSCQACNGVKPTTNMWPTFYECRCGIFFVLDKSSHLCRDDIERISTMNPRMLQIFAEQHPRLLDSFGYPFEERIRDLATSWKNFES